ncbi:MAG: hypothetical protein A4E65_02651 [Syntrophorhabdus sp. PtaU1.Bin153]|nr:MAG: hypothetical protein A4E65_02651 [Syntrophorhabdus sp. PtaU1.Bin153]
MTEKIGAWIGVISSVVTIGLTVYNATLNTRIQQTEIQLKQVESEIRKKSQELEERKERTARYEFVNKLLPDVLKKEKPQVILTTNLITLALTEEEARKLFEGFQFSQDRSIQEVGRIGSENLEKQRERLRSALAHESAGFEALIAGDYQKALSEFETTESVYPTFHQAYEIARLLRQNLRAMSEAKSRKDVFRKIVTEYNYGAPPKYLQKLDELSK